MSFATADSDHLTVYQAYHQWDALGSQGARFGFCRDNFLGMKSLQMLAQMKRQFLELLSDANFVPPGLHARRVEAEGRRSRGGDGCAEALGWANEQHGNVSLIKAVLCAALYPNVAHPPRDSGPPKPSVWVRVCILDTKSLW